MDTNEIERRLLLIADSVKDLDIPESLTILSMFLAQFIDHIDMDINVFCEGMRETYGLASIRDDRSVH